MGLKQIQMPLSSHILGEEVHSIKITVISDLVKISALRPKKNLVLEMLLDHSELAHMI